MTPIKELYPQIELISDEELREQVVGCWEEAIKRGGWQTEDMEKIPFSLLTPDVGVSLAAHTRAVTDCCIAIGEVLGKAYSRNYTLDRDVLVAGAVLHDVGKPLEYKRNPDGKYAVSDNGKLLRHPISGCALAAEFGLPDAVQHIIAVHSREGDGGYRSPEAWIIHHADFVNFEPLRTKTGN